MIQRCKLFVAAASMTVSLSATGCVAMNIPSHRLHDSHDRGGLLGSWNNKTIAAGKVRREQGGTILNQESGIAGAAGSCFSDDQWHDSGIDSQGYFEDDATAAKPDPIPWPQYHPIPTRPAFAPSPLLGHGPY